MNNTYEITDLVVQFAISDRLNSVSCLTKRTLRVSVVDWVTVALAGRNEPASKLIRELEKETGGANESVVIGLKNRLPSRTAAFVNGITGHALDYDDTHFASLGHPSAAVIPAALAIADKTGCAAEKFYDATLVGMELAIRIGVWLGRTHYSKGFHVTSTAGAFGAAMAVSRILDLNNEQAKSAIGIVASRASGIRAQFGTMGKAFHAGIAASSGVEAALLAGKGFAAAQNALEQPLGFGETHNGAFYEKAFDNLGESFTVDNITHKFHACCHGTHATIEALQALKKKENIDSSNIKKIDILVNSNYLNICNIEKPMKGIEAKFSFKLVAALAVFGYDTGSLETFSDEVCQKTSLMKLCNRVSVKSDPDVSETQTKVFVHLSGGKILENTYDLSQGLPIELREDKIFSKAAALIGKPLVENLWLEVGIGDKLPSRWMENNFTMDG